MFKDALIASTFLGLNSRDKSKNIRLEFQVYDGGGAFP
jgi:hypothetical protein